MHMAEIEWRNSKLTIIWGQRVYEERVLIPPPFALYFFHSLSLQVSKKFFINALVRYENDHWVWRPPVSYHFNLSKLLHEDKKIIINKCSTWSCFLIFVLFNLRSTVIQHTVVYGIYGNSAYSTRFIRSLCDIGYAGYYCI